LIATILSETRDVGGARVEGALSKEADFLPIVSAALFLSPHAMAKARMRCYMHAVRGL
jgi:hypothetical protein